jgi:hypothetical protein
MISGLKRIAQAASRHKCTVIFINALGMNIGVMFGNSKARKSFGLLLSLRLVHSICFTPSRCPLHFSELPKPFSFPSNF